MLLSKQFALWFLLLLSCSPLQFLVMLRWIIQSSYTHYLIPWTIYYIIIALFVAVMLRCLGALGVVISHTNYLFKPMSALYSSLIFLLPFSGRRVCLSAPVVRYFNHVVACLLLTIYSFRSKCFDAIRKGTRTSMDDLNISQFGSQ